MSLELSRQKKRILIVGPLPPPYHGVAVMTRWLADGLKKKEGFQFVHLNTQDPKKNKDFGRLTLRNGWQAVRFIFVLLRHLTGERIDVVYVPISQNFWGFARDGIFILISGLLFRRKVVIHLHGGYFKRFFEKASVLGKGYIKFVFRYVDRGIVLGYCLKHVLEDVLPEGRIDVVYNGIDAKQFERLHPERQHNDRFKVLYAGVLREAKGFFDVIKAISEVKRKLPDISVSIAGRWEDEEMRNRTAAYIRDNDLEQNIELTGVVTGDQKTELFKRSDVLVLPSRHQEGQPVSILEAMAAGLPVISTNTGSISEMIIDRQNGFIVPSSSPSDIAEKITFLAENRHLSRKMGLINQKRIGEKFTLDQFVDGVVGTIEKVSSGDRRGDT
ncbi:MAG: glycosyltransferase family 4 protein [Candidatus Zixiibacteriota bacterium]|nr:MAG: glycosyltransferase family 4 protein [candidate division Zixibacteria bacterium]